MLIYSETISPRLEYICDYLFAECAGTAYDLTNDQSRFKSFCGPKLNYSPGEITGGYQVVPHGLLAEHGIHKQDEDAILHAGAPRDILAAAFYLITRYEEYLPHSKDAYGRYDHSQSAAYRYGFLDQPVIHYWLRDLLAGINKLFPHESLVIRNKYHFRPTYDIDIAYAYRGKGLLRNAGGFLKHPTVDRLRVLLSGKSDPDDVYDWLLKLHDTYNLTPEWFFLVARNRSKWEKNISPDAAIYRRLIKQLDAVWPVSLHTSRGACHNATQLAHEKETLDNITGQATLQSRAHYIDFQLPLHYLLLSAAGIRNDFSMGYGSINGFRASAAVPFRWYDLEYEQRTQLWVTPFCFMDANAHYEQKQTPAASFAELEKYQLACKSAGVPLTTIFHNSFLGKRKEFAGWREGYEKFIAQALQSAASPA